MGDEYNPAFQAYNMGSRDMQGYSMEQHQMMGEHSGYYMIPQEVPADSTEQPVEEEVGQEEGVEAEGEDQ